MKKLYELSWILENGNLYASTVVEVMLAAPSERANIVTRWLIAAFNANDWEKHEAELHALAAHFAKEQMNERTVTEPFPGFFNKDKYWWIWMKEQIG